MRTETITRNIYTFDELDACGQESAREWFRDVYQHEEWWDCVYDDVKRAADMLGIDIDQIYFSGFSCQGDGAQFTGSYGYRAGCMAAVRKEWPQDATLHEIARDLVRVQRPWFYTLSATVRSDGRYCHEYDTWIDVSADDDVTGYDRKILEADEQLTEVLRDFMRWTYARLRDEYEYLMSSESVDENIRCNEYEFYSDGTAA